MRILFLSAYCPPYSYGGYENRVRDITDQLASRGHQVEVLTTRADKSLKVNPINFPYPVFRRLYGTRKALSWAERLTMKNDTNRLGVVLVVLRQILRDLRDLRLIDQTIRAFQPDIVYLGNVLPLTHSLLPYLASISSPLVLDDGGKTMEIVYEDHGLWYRFLEEFGPSSAMLRSLKKLFTSLVTNISAGRLKSSWIWPEKINVIFNNNRSQKSFVLTNIPFNASKAVHSGLDLERFSFGPRQQPDQPLRIIVPGRIEPNKGQLDAVRLSALLHQEGVDHLMAIVGDRWNEEYTNQLEAEISKLGINDKVRIMPMQDKDSLIELYHQSDICFFPSYHQTGFSRIPLEAMACGCLMISYGNEGSGEIIRDGENGFIVREGDMGFAKEIVMKLLHSSDVMTRVSLDARDYVERNHSMVIYVDQIESFIAEIMRPEADR